MGRKIETQSCVTCVSLPRDKYEGLTDGATDEGDRGKRFMDLMQRTADSLAGGGMLMAPDTVDRIAGILEKQEFTVQDLVQRLDSACGKRLGSMVLEVVVDQANIPSLEAWAEAAGEKDVRLWVQRGWQYVFNQGWLTGAVLSRSLSFSEEDFAMLCGLIDRQPEQFTGTDLVNIVRLALEESSNLLPFASEATKQPEVQA